MKKILIFTIVSVLCAVSVNAMELSLERAVEMILAESQDLKKAEYNINRARAGLDAVKSNRWPKVSGSASYMNIVNVESPGSPMGINLSGFGSLPAGVPAFIEIPDNIGMLGLTATLPIYTFGRIGNAAEAAGHAIAVAGSGSELAKREICAAAAQIYWTAKMTEEIVKISQKNLQLSINAERRLKTVSRANRANLVKISADIAAKEIALSDAQFNRDSAHRLLKIMSGIKENKNLVLTDEFPDTFAEKTVPQELDANPEWDMLESQIRMHEAQAAARLAERNPVIGANASYNYTMIHNSPRVWNGGDSQSANIGIALQVPIWDGKAARINSDMDMLSADAVRQDLDKSKKLKSNEYRDALLNHERLRANLTQRNTARDLAEMTVQMSIDRFFAGQTSAVELSDVMTALMQMDMAVLNAKFNILIAEESIRKLSGK
ncbi:MAG: TolC family protein [Endomicrobia bacterium]|nr:TolC family protein [Endomicrobiia bacterium]MCL2506170.1 TolC family protein [Endomicrobiia bacterium]